MAYPDDPQRALNDPPRAATVPAEPTDPPLASSLAADGAPKTFSAAFVASLFAAALVACLLAYLAFAVPGRWVSSVPQRAYDVRALAMSRGFATTANGELVVTRAAGDGSVVIAVVTDLRSTDYPVIAWIAAGLPADAKVALLWSTDVEPSRLNTRALDVQSGIVLPLDMHDDPHWLGRVVGLALAVQGSLAEPLRVRGVIAKPATALGTLEDRVREWVAPEPWSGASINTVAGGADVQPLPLPVLLASAIVIVVGALVAISRKRLQRSRRAIASAAIMLALIGWFVLDARWALNLGRQAYATGRIFAGKDTRERHLAAEDRDLFAFIDKALALMPKAPARVFVVAEADFFRGRAAYHLYPHNVWFDPYRNAVPPADRLRAGDWLVVYQRRGVQYDAAHHLVRWDGGATVPVELKLADHGAALFLVQ